MYINPQKKNRFFTKNGNMHLTEKKKNEIHTLPTVSKYWK